MKLNTDHQTIKSNVGQSSQFKIEANGAAFKILSDNLYQYPIRAIVRELSTNAIDANVQAKKTLNDFEITVPNSLNPQFAIEDHGVGMSEDDILNTYTSFFSSTKSGSNEQTGMFGLGSKTPFAYTSQFIIESSKDGVTNVFTAFKDDSGLPSVKKINSRDSNGKTGTKVMFAVKEKDFYEFYKAIVMSAATWPGLPKFNGEQALNDFIRRYYSVKDSSKALEITNNIFKSEKLDSKNENFIEVISDKFCLEMGTVLYHISTQELAPEIVSFINNTNRDSRYVIHAPIGAVSITPSREELQYDAKTKEYLNKEILGVFVNNIVIPTNLNSAKEKWVFFHNDDFNRLSKLKASDVCEKAQKHFEEVMKAFGEYKSEIEKIVEPLKTENCFIVLPDYWDSKYDNRPHYPLNSKFTKGNYTPFMLFETFLSNTNVEHIHVVELNDKEISHINTSNAYVANGFFTVRYRSILLNLKNGSKKENKRSEVNQNCLAIFGPKGIAQKIKDSYFNINFELINDWTSIVDAYKGVSATTKDPQLKLKCFSILSSGYDWRNNEDRGGTVETTGYSFEDFQKAVASAPKGTKVFYCPTNRDRYMIFNPKVALTQKASDISSYMEYNHPLRAFSGKCLMIAGKLTDLKKCNAHTSYKYVYEELKTMLTSKMDTLYRKYQGFSASTGNAFYREFPKRAYNHLMSTYDFSKTKSLFMENMTKYRSSASYNDEIEEIYSATRYFDSTLFTYLGDTNTYNNYSPKVVYLNDLVAKFRSSGSNKGEIADLIAKYPMARFLEDYLPYSKSWNGYTGDEERAKAFVDYVAMVDGATKI